MIRRFGREERLIELTEEEKEALHTRYVKGTDNSALTGMRRYRCTNRLVIEEVTDPLLCFKYSFGGPESDFRRFLRQRKKHGMFLVMQSPKITVLDERTQYCGYAKTMEEALEIVRANGGELIP